MNAITVSQLNNYIKGVLDTDRLLTDILVMGEISNFKQHSSGHLYFTLKDNESIIRAVVFKQDAFKIKFKPDNGLKVIVRGRISLFLNDGQYRLYCAEVLPDGIGALNLAFEQLKEKLFNEGLFDEKLKKPLPKYPSKIGIITSATGAVVSDILRILKQRYPLSKILICPVHVQGDLAAPEICEAISILNKKRAVDVIITGRGGGSLEDLWAFNEETVARAIFSSQIPIISAVGHEPDITIADFVADIRASTPSNAAEICSPDMQNLRIIVNNHETRLLTLMGNKISLYRERLTNLQEKRVMKDSTGYIKERSLALDFLSERLQNLVRNKISIHKQKYIRLSSAIDALSPLKVISRGYSVVTNEQNHVITSIKNIKKGDNIKITVTDGILKCEVKDEL